MPHWIMGSTHAEGKDILMHRYVFSQEEPRLDGFSRFIAFVLGGVNPVRDQQGHLSFGAFVGPETRTFSNGLDAFTWVQNQVKSKITAG